MAQSHRNNNSRPQSAVVALIICSTRQSYLPCSSIWHIFCRNLPNFNRVQSKVDILTNQSLKQPKSTTVNTLLYIFSYSAVVWRICSASVGGAYKWYVHAERCEEKQVHCAEKPVWHMQKPLSTHNHTHGNRTQQQAKQAKNTFWSLLSHVQFRAMVAMASVLSLVLLLLFNEIYNHRKKHSGWKSITLSLILN